jgi:hypothetical protein
MLDQNPLGDCFRSNPTHGKQTKAFECMIFAQFHWEEIRFIRDSRNICNHRGNLIYLHYVHLSLTTLHNFREHR